MFPTDEILTKYKLFWQYPVITEKTFYLQNKDNDNFLGFPWATIFDKRYNPQVIFNILKQYIDSGKTYYSCCQHIHFKYFIGLWSALNIKTVYISHKVKGEDIINGITLKPCPLYALNIEDTTINKEFQGVDLLNVERPILYNFIGGYQPNYLTQIRPNIFKMKHPENTVIKNTGMWHLDKLVYNSAQNVKQELNVNDEHINKTKYYNELLIKSRYTLAPSGSGPNSIRFWEALGAGSIPVLLADTLELPEHELWNDAIIRLQECELDNLLEKLKKITLDEELTMRENCLKIYNDLKDNYICIKNKQTFNSKIAVVTFFTLNYTIGFDTMLINKSYCKINKYDFFVYNDDPDSLKNKHPAWYKLYYVNKVLQEYKYEYVFWIDADAFFCNNNLRIENYINDTKDFIVARDSGYSLEEYKNNKYKINSGVFIFKNTDWSKKFINNLLFASKFYKWNKKNNWEQEAIRECIIENVNNINEHIEILIDTNFNNNTNNLINYIENGGFIIHLTNFMGKFKSRSIDTITNYNSYQNQYINKSNNDFIPNVLFTSYLCDKNDPIVEQILQNWKIKNPEFEIKYFSDDDVDMFFENHYKKDSYKKLKNGVAKADFFRICYINTYGGYWFDIDIEPLSLNKNNLNNIALFDLGFKNISYMLIGGKKKPEII